MLGQVGSWETISRAGVILRKEMRSTSASLLGRYVRREERGMPFDIVVL